MTLPGQQTTGNLVAIGPGNGNFSFEWSAYDSLSSAYGAVFQTDNATSESVATGLNDGGYKVRVYNSSGIDTSFLAWIFIDHLRDSIEKDSFRECTSQQIYL